MPLVRRGWRRFCHRLHCFVTPPGRGIQATLLAITFITCLTLISLRRSSNTFLEFYFNVRSKTCDDFWEYVRADSEWSWMSEGVSGSPPELTINTRPPGWYARNVLDSTPLCSDFPENLKGILNVSVADQSWWELEEKYGFEVQEGGWWRPTHCRPRHRVAVIIPYRDRDSHLRVLLNHLHPFMMNQLVDYRIFVAEQDFVSAFNRGMMKNIGALYALQTFDFDCFYFHDVDLLPEHDHNLYYCRDVPRHVSVAVDSVGYKKYYYYHFGGVVTIMKEQFLAVNGYSNAYFRWGSEDDDLSKRIRYSGFGLEQNRPELGRYKMIPHKKDSPNKDRWRIVKWAHCRFEWDGLNSLVHRLISLENRPLFTRIHVSVNETQVMRSIPLPPPPTKKPTKPSPTNVGPTKPCTCGGESSGEGKSNQAGVPQVPQSTVRHEGLWAQVDDNDDKIDDPFELQNVLKVAIPNKELLLENPNDVQLPEVFDNV